MGSPDVEVRRSRKRRRTVSAYREGGRTIVLIPARFTRAEEQQWVDTMLERLAKGDKRRRPSDAQLAPVRPSSRSATSGARPGRRASRWVTNQNSRWGSCTPADGTIRIPRGCRGMPAFVLDYVMLHELAHLLSPGHGPDFWRLLEGYPRLERARGYLEGVAATAGLDLSDGETESDELGQAALDFGPERLTRATCSVTAAATRPSSRRLPRRGVDLVAAGLGAARPRATRRRRATPR